MIATALKVSQSLYCFTTFRCHGVENYFPRLWGTGISDAILWFILGRYNIHHIYGVGNVKADIL